VDPREGERALQRAYQLLPGLGEPVPVRIEESSPVAGLALSDLGLRGRTGATIIAISRGKDVVLVPDGHETLRAGDVVALAGTRPAIEAARQLLLYGKET
jgi:CPA2 family monovalent cation:H+ antiporter-2